MRQSIFAQMFAVFTEWPRASPSVVPQEVQVLGSVQVAEVKECDFVDGIISLQRVHFVSAQVELSLLCPSGLPVCVPQMRQVLGSVQVAEA